MTQPLDQTPHDRMPSTTTTCRWRYPSRTRDRSRCSSRNAQAARVCSVTESSKQRHGSAYARSGRSATAKSQSTTVASPSQAVISPRRAPPLSSPPNGAQGDAGEHCRFPRKQHCGEREPGAALPHHPAEDRRGDQRCFDMCGQLLARISGVSDDAGSCEAHIISCLIFGRRIVSEERVVAKSRSATFGPRSRSLNPAIVRS